MLWRYFQSTGKLFKDNSFIGIGYSGTGMGLNNPKAQSVHNIGPIPIGLWKIGPWVNNKHLGPCVAFLEPSKNTNTFDRSGFFIHGDNKLMNHSASEGCIILSRALREQIKDSGITQIEIVE